MTEVRIDVRSPVPPFEQLRQQFAQLIRSGALAPGSKLPTVRQLAADLGLANNTVSGAYSALEQAGLVRADRRRGTTVTDRAQLGQRERHRLVIEAAGRYLAELDLLRVSPDEALGAVQELLVLRVPP